MIWNRKSTGCTYISLYWSRCSSCRRDGENSSWQNPQRSLLLRHWCWQPRCYREKQGRTQSKPNKAKLPAHPVFQGKPTRQGSRKNRCRHMSLFCDSRRTTGPIYSLFKAASVLNAFSIFPQTLLKKLGFHKMLNELAGSSGEILCVCMCGCMCVGVRLVLKQEVVAMLTLVSVPFAIH